MQIAPMFLTLVNPIASPFAADVVHVSRCFRTLQYVLALSLTSHLIAR